MARRQTRALLIIVIASGGLLTGTALTLAQACENPWGSVSYRQQTRSGLPTVEDVRFCLPSGFFAEVRKEGVSFRDPADAAGSRGRLGLAISPDSTYKYSDDEKDYHRLQAWLCQLANISAGTRCVITRLKGKLFVLLKGIEINVHSEVYIHAGNGYMVALTAVAPNEAELSSLRAVIQDADIP